MLLLLPMARRLVFAALTLIAWIVAARLHAADPPVRIAAAASLTDALTEATTAFTRQTGTPVNTVFAGSMTLARQIDSGAPIDLFFSADDESVDFLRQRQKIENSENLLSNRLAVVIRANSTRQIHSASDLIHLPRLAIGEPHSVPVGRYTRIWLTRQKLWETLQPRCVGFDNVRTALAAVESGQIEAAVVYASDARERKKSRLAFLVPAADAPAILYPLAHLKHRSSPQARALAAFLRGPQAMKIFRRHGFSTLHEPPPESP